MRSHVVYKYTCPKVGCNATYIGYTTCKLRKRAQQHRYKSSSISKHHSMEHSDDPSIPQDFFEDFTIIHKADDITNLRTLEAIYIKEENPQINVKFNELSNHMNLFKWPPSPLWWWCIVFFNILVWNIIWLSLYCFHDITTCGGIILTKIHVKSDYAFVN